MNQPCRKLVVLLFGVTVAVVWVVGGAAEVAAKDQPLTPEAVMRGAKIEPHIESQVPLDLKFQNDQGKSIALRSLLQDRPVVLHLVYYECPMLCKLSGDGLIQALADLDLSVGDDFDVWTVSFDPREGLQLSAKAKEFSLGRYGRAGAESNWHFLTGDQPTIDELLTTVGFDVEFDPATNQYAHPAGIYVLTPEGKVSSFLAGVQFVTRDVNLALVEASQGKVGSFADRILLTCYQYDPITGKYGLAIISVLRVLGVLTIGGIASLVLLLLRRERRLQTGSPATGVTAESNYQP